MLHSYPHLNITLIRRTNGEACDHSNKAVLSDVGKHCIEEYHVILIRKELINALLTCFAGSVVSLMHISSRNFTFFDLRRFWRVTFLSAVTSKETNSAPKK